MIDFTNQYKIWDTFLAEWPISRLREMDIDQYSLAGSKETFTYWIESKLDNMGSIWGGSAFKFGVFSRGNAEIKADDVKRRYSASHGWLASLGETHETAFQSVRNYIVQVAELARAGDLEAIDAFGHLGLAFKWKIAFHYQDRKAPTLLAIFKPEALAAFLGLSANDGTASLQRQVMRKKPDGMGVLEFGHHVWEEWSKVNLPIWKLSHDGPSLSDYERANYLKSHLAVMHGLNDEGDAAKFRSAEVGDLFFLCHGNSPKLLGQFTTPVSSSAKSEGWMQRRFRLIKEAQNLEAYEGPSRAWSPNGKSKFHRVGARDLPDFEKSILEPYFQIDLAELASMKGASEDIEDLAFEPSPDGGSAAGHTMGRGVLNPVNLIFYGPPGTGKTYATAWEAVRICLGDEAAKSLQDNRELLMAEYRRLVTEGRIEFVTFHQSFSYEDFVEGLRPTTQTSLDDDGQEHSAPSAGFSLKPHPGVFKRISERARLDTGNAVTKRLDRSRAIFKIALGQRGSQEEWIREGLDQNLIHLGWGGDIDWSDDRFDDFEEIRKKWNSDKDPSASGKDPNIEVTYAFRSALQVGDYVIISDGRDSFRAFGQVMGEYEFATGASFHPHRRKVEWIWRSDSGAARASFYPNNFRRQSAYRLDASLVDWDALEAIVVDMKSERPVAEARPHVLIIDEINRGNISKVFGELITLLEIDKRLGGENEVRVRLPYSGARFGVPSNLNIIGTMNTADRSIALLDTALRRRFEFRELMPDINALQTALAAKNLDANNLGGINLCKFLTVVNNRIEYLFDREHQIGHAYFTGCRSRDDVQDVVRNKVIPLLSEYFYDDWSKVAAVLGDGIDKSHFFEHKRISAVFTDDELGEDKLRWSVKKEFDFSEFEA